MPAAPLLLAVSLLLGTLALGAVHARSAAAAGAQVNVVGPSAFPAFAADAPDPAVIRAGNAYYAYTTGTWWGNQIGILTSNAPTTGWRWPTGQNWGNSAFPNIPYWQGVAPWQQDRTQNAPGIFYWGGKYVLYYTARQIGGHFCISVATSQLPQGPFFDQSGSSPWWCQNDYGGAIDPAPFIDGTGKGWLVWKTYDGLDEGTPRAQAARIWMAPLTNDGLGFTGPATQILLQDGYQTIENPQMINAGGTYILLLSRNRWDSPAYAEYYSICAAPPGPCNTPDPFPFLGSYQNVLGPGGATAFDDGSGHWYLAYAGWRSSCFTYGPPCNGARELFVAPLTLVGMYWGNAVYTARLSSDAYTLLQRAATWWQMSPAATVKAGVGALAYLTGLRGGTQTPMLPPPANNGTSAVNVSWDTADEGAVQSFAHHYFINGDQTHYVGAVFMIYVWAAHGAP